jgi:hypothetical protein
LTGATPPDITGAVELGLALITGAFTTEAFTTGALTPATAGIEELLPFIELFFLLFFLLAFFLELFVLLLLLLPFLGLLLPTTAFFALLKAFPRAPKMPPEFPELFAAGGFGSDAFILYFEHILMSSQKFEIGHNFKNLYQNGLHHLSRYWVRTPPRKYILYL